MIVSDERVVAFVSDQLDIALCPPFTAMGIERGGQIIGGVVFNHFEGCDVHVTVAGRGWTRAFIAAVGAYVFDQLGCQRMTAVTDQQQVARLAERLGGRVEGCLRHHFGYARDGIIAGILRDEWRYGSKDALAHG